MKLYFPTHSNIETALKTNTQTQIRSFCVRKCEAWHISGWRRFFVFVVIFSPIFGEISFFIQRHQKQSFAWNGHVTFQKLHTSWHAFWKIGKNADSPTVVRSRWRRTFFVPCRLVGFLRFWVSRHHITMIERLSQPNTEGKSIFFCNSENFTASWVSGKIFVYSREQCFTHTSYSAAPQGKKGSNVLNFKKSNL